MPRSIWLLPILAAAAALFSLALAPTFGGSPTAAPTGAHQSLYLGANLHNTHFAEAEAVLSPANVSRLAVKWSFETTGDVSAELWGQCPLLGTGEVILSSPQLKRPAVVAMRPAASRRRFAR